MKETIKKIHSEQKNNKIIALIGVGLLVLILFVVCGISIFLTLFGNQTEKYFEQKATVSVRYKEFSNKFASIPNNNDKFIYLNESMIEMQKHLSGVNCERVEARSKAECKSLKDNIEYFATTSEIWVKDIKELGKIKDEHINQEKYFSALKTINDILDN